VATADEHLNELIDAIETKAAELEKPVLAEMQRRHGITPDRLGERFIELGRFSAAFAALKVLQERGLLLVSPEFAAALMQERS
jgi:ribosomal protein S25